MVKPNFLVRNPHKKTIETIWFEVEATLDSASIAFNLGKKARSLLRRNILQKVSNNDLYVFECVAVPATGTDKSVLRIGVSGAFKLAVTKAAKDLVAKQIQHGNHLH